MTDYYQLGKPIDIPDHLLASVARFIKNNDQVAIGAEELNFWMESGQKYFKTSEAMVETMLINPGEAVSSETNDFNITNVINSLEKKSLRGIMNDLGPISTNDTDLLK
jgi:hypothetical protein